MSRLSVELSPISPLEFNPQHTTVASGRSAHVCVPGVNVPSPDEIDRIEVNPGNTMGVERVRIVPSPSCPSVPVPQHEIVPSFLRAQVWALPAATSTIDVRVNTG